MDGKQDSKKCQALLDKYVNCVMDKNHSDVLTIYKTVTNQSYTADSVRTIQKAYYTFNQDGTVLTYSFESKVAEYYAKPSETPKKEIPTFLKMFEDALDILLTVALVVLVLLFLLACGL
jgi:ascorbate-specific PTS system EIIC-type component UlaA